MLSFICAAYPFRHPRLRGYKRAAYDAEYMWHCSAQGLPFRRIAAAERKLLPYIFTLIPHMAGQLFSAALSLPGLSRAPCLTQGGLPFAVRTFLPDKISER